MPADIADKLYYFQDFKCAVAGVDYAVMSVVLAMQESGIPTVVLTINPKDNPNAADISTASVEEFSAWHSKLQAKANTTEGKVDLSFSVKSKSETQEISLKDWQLTQVGFDNIAASGGFNAKLVIQHPVYAATNAVLAMLDTYYDSGIGDSLTKSDIVTMILASMDKYLKQKNPNTEKEEEGSIVSESATTINAEAVKAIDVVLHKKAVAALKVLKDHLEWDPDYKGGNTPFPGVEGFDDHLALSGLEVGAYLIDRASPYHTFMSMAGQMILTTRGAFNNDKLRVRPFEPWAASELKIKVDELSQIALPVYSVNAVSGVVTMGSERTIVVSNAADGSVKGQAEQGPTVIFGGYLAMADRVDGYVRSINMPDWITAFAAGDPAGPALANQGGQNSDPGITASGKDPDVDNSTLEFSETLETMLNAYGHDDFWRGFRADVTVSAGLKLTLAKDGKPLRPGIVVDLVSSDDKVVLTCYIISVQHTISVQDAQAYTSIVGSYVRGPEGVGSGDTRVYNPGSPVTSAIYSKTVKGSGTKKSTGASKTPVPSGQTVVAEESYNEFTAGMPTGVS